MMNPILKTLGLGLVLASAALAAPATASAETVLLQSVQNGRYVAAGRDGYLAANTDQGARAQGLELVRLEGNRVAFRDPASGRFLRAGVTGSTLLAVGAPHIRGWETFEMRRLGGGQIALRSVQNGRYVRAGVGRGALLAAVSERVAGWETFRLVPFDARAEAPRPPHEERPRDERVDLAGSYRVIAVANPGGRGVERLERSLSRGTQVTIQRGGAFSGTVGCNQFNGEMRQRRGAVRSPQDC